MTDEIEVKKDASQLLKNTLRYLLVALISMIIGYVAVLLAIKPGINDELMMNIGVILYVIGYFSYLFLSQQLAGAFERNKGFNFLMLTFFPIGTIANYLIYRKEINKLFMRV